MKNYREGEEGYGVPLRTDRFFSVNTSWYFTTREGPAVGPFFDKGDAQKGLMDFIDFVKLADEKVLNTFLANYKLNI